MNKNYRTAENMKVLNRQTRTPSNTAVKVTELMVARYILSRGKERCVKSK